MIGSIYLTVTKGGVQKMSKRLPPTRAGEIVVKLDLDVSDELFVVPTISAKVSVSGIRERRLTPQSLVLSAQEALAAVGIRAEIVLVEKPEGDKDYDSE